MKIGLDTSIIVDLDRGEKLTKNLLRKLILQGDDVFVSTVVCSEIFTGAYLREDFKKATSKVRSLFSQIRIVPLDIEDAEIIGELNAFLISNGKPIEYQDVAIVAAFIKEKGDYLLTKNKKHFIIFPKIASRVFTPEEFEKILR